MFVVEELQLLPSPEPVLSPEKLQPVSPQRERDGATALPRALLLPLVPLAFKEPVKVSPFCFSPVSVNQEAQSISSSVEEFVCVKLELKQAFMLMGK